MRNLKKILALVLAMVMTFSVMATANAFSDDAQINADYDVAVNVLAGMGVFEGYEDGSFRPTGAITRAEVAAIIYRIATADVKDVNVGLYADYNKFEDVKETAWYAGYVNYCANAEYIKGYNDTTFGPNDKVTGYQALAMILRAVGYDQNNEWTGNGWEVKVASTAKSLKITDTLAGVTLNAAATREVVAEILFRTLYLAPEVIYTPSLGYYTNIVAGVHTLTLGVKNFNLAGPISTTDDWGRPGYKYTYKTGDKSTAFAIDPLAVHTTATTDCVVANEMELVKGDHNVALWVNGVNYTRKINIAADYDALGGQGILVEVYADRIVLIDTFLAKVGTAHPAVYDKSGHVISPAYTEILVCSTATDNTAVGTADTLDGIGYTAGDYILVNINLGKDYTVSLGSAKTIVGAQTLIWQNAAKHTVAGTTYDDAAYFNLDQAKNDAKASYTWYFDQYGNLIGVTEIKATYTYATIKDIQWINPQSAFGYAQATLVYVDGTTENVVVSTIGENVLSYTLFAGDYETGAVSANYGYNAEFIGKKLFAVAKDANGIAYLTEVTPAITGATVTKGNPVVTGSSTCYVDDSTLYLVRSGASEYVYTWATVTGFNQITSLTNATVYYVNLDTDAAAEYVYMYGTPATSSASKLVYMDNLSYNWAAGTTGFITLKGAEVLGELADVVVNEQWLDGAGTELKDNTVYYMVDANGNGKIEATAGERVAEIGTEAVELTTGTFAKKLAANSYKVLNNAIEVTGEVVPYNTLGAALYNGTAITGAEEIVVVYKNFTISAIYVIDAE